MIRPPTSVSGDRVQTTQQDGRKGRQHHDRQAEVETAGGGQQNAGNRRHHAGQRPR